MPHSGGGGSSGGGSHGGSHGGSSHRTSNTYFYGSRRYRRHYRDGHDEYFYSNGRPQKTGLSGIIIIALFGGLFTFMMGLGITSDVTHKIKEDYRRPDSYVWDEAGIIEDDESLNDVLEEYNDETGACPVVYTTVFGEYSEYGSLEDFAYRKYVTEFDDEKHYLLVLAVPEDQIGSYLMSGAKIRSFAWEIMIGDDTNGLYDNYESSFIRDVQNGLEDGEEPGEVLEDAFTNLLALDKKAISKPVFLNLKVIAPLLFIGGIFVLIIIAMIMNYRREKNFEYEEVPLTDDDIKLGRSGAASSMQFSDALNSPAGTAVKAISIVFMIPFVLVGIGMIIGGGALIANQGASGAFLLIFGIVWTLISVISIVTTVKAFSRKKKEGAPLTAEYPKAEYPKAQMPAAPYPEQGQEPQAEFNPFAPRKSDYDDDDDGLRRKGYE